MGLFGKNKVNKDDDPDGAELEVHDEMNKDHFQNTEPGPMEKRSCTDILFLLLFIAFWVGMFIVAKQAIANGRPQRLIYGVDSEGNICGENNLAMNESLRGRARDLSNNKYLYFLPQYSDATGIYFDEVCISSCPKESHLIPDATDELICSYDVTPSLDNLFPNGSCMGSFNTKSLVHRCIPIITANYTQIVGEVTSALNLQQATDMSLRLISDLVGAWRYIAISAAVAFVLSFGWMVLMRKFAGVIIWTTIVAAIGCITVLAGFVYKQANMNQASYDSLPIYLRLASETETIKFLKAAFIVLVIIDAICVLITLFMFRRIKIGVGLFEETSKAMMKMPAVIFVPVGIAIAIIPLAIYWLWIGAYLATTGEPTFDANGKFDGYSTTSRLRYLQIYHLFGGFWTLNFLHAVGEATIAGAIGSYYWIHDKSELTHFPVFKAFIRTLRYHMGSLLFGSLILAAVQLIRFLFAQFEKRMKGNQNRLAKCAMRTVDCLLACFERFIKFINENAYIMVAIYGYSFCGGARRGFSLMARNILRVGALSCVSSFLIFLGKVFVTALTTLIFFFVLRNDSSVTNFVLPLIAIAALSYAVSAAFFGVIRMAIKTILLSFCEDCERNDGSEKKPYYMSDQLKSIVDSEHTCFC